MREYNKIELEVMLKASRYIEGIRQRKSMSKRSLAKKVEVSSTYLNHVITCKKVPSKELIISIANVLEINEKELMKKYHMIHPEDLREFTNNYLGDQFKQEVGWF